MVDGHEFEEQKDHRSNHTLEYLAAIEPGTHRWIQLPLEEFEALNRIHLGFLKVLLSAPASCQEEGKGEVS